MIESGETVWAALSGGADSVCLLSLLKKLQSDLHFNLKAVHINHLLRGRESDVDESYCRNLCNKMGIHLDVFSMDAAEYAGENSMSVEEAGRTIRYNIFERKCPGKVAVAHNMDDNAETFMMNLMRGSGTKGLSGISEISGKYIRPLMNFRKSEIEEYCSAENLQFRYDSSNDDTKYFRNAVRHKLIPLMNELADKDMVPVLDRTAATIAEDSEYLESTAKEAYTNCTKLSDERIVIDNDKYRNYHPAIASRVLRRSFLEIEGSLKDFEKKNLKMLDTLVKQGKTGESLDLSARTFAVVQFGQTILSGRTDICDYEYSLHVPGKIFIEERNISISSEYHEGKEKPGDDPAIYIKADKPVTITVRNRRNGDRINPSGGNGSKKLKKYFIGKKINRFERNRLFLVLIDGKIAYIEGMDHGKGFKPDESSGYIRLGVNRGRKEC